MSKYDGYPRRGADKESVERIDRAYQRKAREQILGRKTQECSDIDSFPKHMRQSNMFEQENFYDDLRKDAGDIADKRKMEQIKKKPENAQDYANLLSFFAKGAYGLDRASEDAYDFERSDQRSSDRELLFESFEKLFPSLKAPENAAIAKAQLGQLSMQLMAIEGKGGFEAIKTNLERLKGAIGNDGDVNFEDFRVLQNAMKDEIVGGVNYGEHSVEDINGKVIPLGFKEEDKWTKLVQLRLLYQTDLILKFFETQNESLQEVEEEAEKQPMTIEEAESIINTAKIETFDDIESLMTPEIKAAILSHVLAEIDDRIAVAESRYLERGVRLDMRKVGHVFQLVRAMEKKIILPLVAARRENVSSESMASMRMDGYLKEAFGYDVESDPQRAKGLREFTSYFMD